jgi:hypothetical protein
MSIDRYEAICRPLLSLNWSKKRGFLFIAIAFGLAHLQGIPQLFLFKMRPILGILEKFETCQALFPSWFVYLNLYESYICHVWPEFKKNN